MRIVDLADCTTDLKLMLAGYLVEGFAEHWPDAWPTLADAQAEIEAMLDAERIGRVALDDADQPLGVIGGIPEYDGHVWELHPLVVAVPMQGRGIGKALVQDFEAQVAAHGGLSIRVGTDDEAGLTTLSNANLYQDLPQQLANIRNLGRHPYEFYQKLGYSLVGVVPDANGIGKPDILLAKPIGPR
jgi:aminoglycoside 6'-N-acetyltransferase I